MSSSRGHLQGTTPEKLTANVVHVWTGKTFAGRSDIGAHGGGRRGEPSLKHAHDLGQ